MFRKSFCIPVLPGTGSQTALYTASHLQWEPTRKCTCLPGPARFLVPWRSHCVLRWEEGHCPFIVLMREKGLQPWEEEQSRKNHVSLPGYKGPYILPPPPPEDKSLGRWLSRQEHWLSFHRTQVGFPEPTRWLTTICNFSSRGSDASSNLHRHQTCMQCSDTQTNNFFKKERQEADQSAGGMRHCYCTRRRCRFCPPHHGPRNSTTAKLPVRGVVRVLATYPGGLQVAKAGYLAAVTLHELSGVPCVT